MTLKDILIPSEKEEYWTIDSEALERELKPWREKEDCRVKRNGEHHAHTYSVPCPYKYCVILICSHCNKIEGAFGQVGCPCDLFPNWHSHYIDGISKPRVPALTKGKYRSRVTRSIRRHQYPQSFLNWFNQTPKESENLNA